MGISAKFPAVEPFSHARRFAIGYGMIGQTRRFRELFQNPELIADDKPKLARAYDSGHEAQRPIGSCFRTRKEGAATGSQPTTFAGVGHRAVASTSSNKFLPKFLPVTFRKDERRVSQTLL
jgi:hypothetical protein